MAHIVLAVKLCYGLDDRCTQSHHPRPPSEQTCVPGPSLSASPFDSSSLADASELKGGTGPGAALLRSLWAQLSVNAHKQPNQPLQPPECLSHLLQRTFKPKTQEVAIPPDVPHEDAIQIGLPSWTEWLTQRYLYNATPGRTEFLPHGPVSTLSDEGDSNPDSDPSLGHPPGSPPNNEKRIGSGLALTNIGERKLGQFPGYSTSFRQPLQHSLVVPRISKPSGSRFSQRIAKRENDKVQAGSDLSANPGDSHQAEGLNNEQVDDSTKPMNSLSLSSSMSTAAGSMMIPLRVTEEEAYLQVCIFHAHHSSLIGNSLPFPHATNTFSFSNETPSVAYRFTNGLVC